jgi:hypothetical protein
MIKSCQSHINKHQKIDNFFELLKSWKHRHLHTKEKEKLLKSSFDTQIVTNNSDNEMIISCSGQAKIDNLDSCLDLDDCDFIFFKKQKN